MSKLDEQFEPCQTLAAAALPRSVCTGTRSVYMHEHTSSEESGKVAFFMVL